MKRLERILMQMTLTGRGTTKDSKYEETEVTEFMRSNTPNVKSQGSVEIQITEFPQVDQVFLYTESVT